MAAHAHSLQAFANSQSPRWCSIWNWPPAGGGGFTYADIILSAISVSMRSLSMSWADVLLHWVLLHAKYPFSSTRTSARSLARRYAVIRVEAVPKYGTAQINRTNKRKGNNWQIANSLLFINCTLSPVCPVNLRSAVLRYCFMTNTRKPKFSTAVIRLCTLGRQFRSVPT